MQERSVYGWVQKKAWLQNVQNEVLPKLKRDTFGPSPPNIFVGEYGYPNVRAGPLVALAEAIVDAPQDLYGLNYPELLRQRGLLARGYTARNVRNVSDEGFWIAASQKPVDVEARFTKAPAFSLEFSNFTAPAGPSGELERLRVTQNPAVPKKVDSLVGENLKVADALPELLARFEYDYIQKILSAGILGKDRKLVPTKWGITATDDMIAKKWLETVRDFPALNECRIYANNYLYNHFEVLLLPGAWEFEQFESFENKTHIAHEYEGFEGRTKYAAEEGGGYYAGRFGVVEALLKMRKQARCIVFREVSPDYTIPGGVWVVRESVRNAFTKPPVKCATQAEAWQILKTRLKQSPASYRAKSRILAQRTLSQY